MLINATEIKNLDHLVLTVSNITNSCKFYKNALGMEIIQFGENRKALNLAIQKINLHQPGNEFEPKAYKPMPGTADLYFITDYHIKEVITELSQNGIEIERDPSKELAQTAKSYQFIFATQIFRFNLKII